MFTFSCNCLCLSYIVNSLMDWILLFRVRWTARRSNQSILKEISPGVHWKYWCWSWNSNTLATWCEELTHLKRPWCWERLRAGGEEDDRGWDGWMASRTQWTWVWVDSGSWWWTGRPGVLRFMGSQSVGHNWATELNWTEGSLREILKYGSSEASSERCSIRVVGERGTLKKLSKWGPERLYDSSCLVGIK